MMILYPVANPHIGLLKTGTVNLFGYHGDIMIRSGILHRRSNVWRDEKGLRKFFCHKTSSYHDTIVVPSINRTTIYYKVFSELVASTDHTYEKYCKFRDEILGKCVGQPIDCDEFIRACQRFCNSREGKIRYTLQRETSKYLRELGYKPDFKIYSTTKAYAKYKILVDDDKMIFLNDMPEDVKRDFRIVFNDL